MTLNPANGPLPKPRRTRRRGHRDPVSADTYSYVIARDGYGCVAPQLDAEGPCTNRWGDAIYSGAGRFTSDDLTLDHVRDVPMMGKRAPSDARHLVTLCWGHHLGGWATANRPTLRAYIRRIEDDLDARRRQPE